MSLLDQDTGVVDGLGKSELENLGLFSVFETEFQDRKFSNYYSIKTR